MITWNPFRNTPNPKKMRIYLSVLVISLVELTIGEEFTMGYITGSERFPGDVVYRRPGLMISGAISLAVEEVNRKHPLFGNFSLGFIVAETYGQEEISIRRTAELKYVHNVSAYIGPQETCVVEARMAASFNLPMISYYCASFETSDKHLFPTFTRTKPPETQISTSVASVLLNFNWKKVAFLYSNDSQSSNKVAKTILKTFAQHGIEVTYQNTWNFAYYHEFVDSPFEDIVKQSYQKTRIYVILGYHDDHLGLMLSLHNQGLLEEGEYFVVGLDMTQYIEDDPGRFMTGLLSKRNHTDEVAQAAFRSYIGVVASLPHESFRNFTEKVNEYNYKEPFVFNNALKVFGVGSKVAAEAAYLYDAVHLYAKALNHCLINNLNPHNGTLLSQLIHGQTYKSAMGYLVDIDEHGDAEGNYTLIARKPDPEIPGEYGLYSVGVFQTSVNESSLPNLLMRDTIDWVGGAPPIDEPLCGFKNERCQLAAVEDSYGPEIAGSVAGGVGLMLIIIVLAIYRNWVYEQELDSLLWKIEYKELNFNKPISGKNNFRFIKGASLRSSQMSLCSNPDTDFRYSTIYSESATYKGNICAIKRIKKKGIDMTRAMKKELKTIRDLRHDNLNAFIGACVDPPNICIITEYSSRGSLQDILENDDVKLDNMFIASLIEDIIRGIIFLHDSSIRSHGNLKSSNCLVDSRWVVKISDFGLNEFLAGSEPDKDAGLAFESHCTDLLTKAPELLRNTNPPQYGTQKGDVYSFGFILYEIHSRNGPWGNVDMTSSEILRLVMKQDKLSIIRPNLDLVNSTFLCVRETLIDCWRENPEERPDFKQIRSKLRPMRKGMKPNIFDNMIAMMEKYANNLEALVDERTDQLSEEKKKTDALLYEMLPRYVADQLKRGHKVQAESFDCVTIYFSDIVGFTSMSAESSPLQVVDFLNDLYTCFDSIIGNYDVYKVETIGDAYMVVSGLPIRNEDQHTGEIASMSLHLLEKVRKFKVRHKPSHTLHLRIGIHSGPVCAGVVGLKMPRYCLFGDTVNTASRLESTGLPLKIHISSQCRDILVKMDGYILEKRGMVNFKGKGDFCTYWLIGETAENKEKRSQSTQKKLINSIGSRLTNGVIPGRRLSKKKIHSRENSCDGYFNEPISSDSPQRIRFMSVKERSKKPKLTSTSSDSVRSPKNSTPYLDKKQYSCPCIDKKDNQSFVRSPVNFDLDHSICESSIEDSAKTPLIHRRGTLPDYSEILDSDSRIKRFSDSKSMSLDSTCRVEMGDLGTNNDDLMA